MSSLFLNYAELADTFAFRESRRAMGGQQAWLVREPVGVVGAIVPWNSPATLTTYKVAPALLAGCTVVLKTPTEAPCSGFLFAEICEEIGLPPGVINVVPSNREGSRALVADSRVDKITFTGSTEVGRDIASTLGQRIGRFTLELGGKSPAVILDDYDLDAAARTLAGNACMNAGQVCHSLTRVIVPRHRHDALVDALSTACSSQVIGDPFDPLSGIGPLATDRQRANVERYIAIGKAEGATLACGGSRPKGLSKGYYFEPTVFGNVDNLSAIGQDEIFGPVLSVIPAADEADAIRLANQTIYGLNATIFTNDEERFLALAPLIRSGTVGQNASRTDVTIAFGGMKQSGIGREGGVDGLLAYLESKVVVVDRPWGVPVD
jgi:betaine-aldehyde dehydrogenase